MTTRKAKRALACWETDTRAWAIQAARNLVLDMYEGRPLPITPYQVGVVLFPGERVWAEIPARFAGECPPFLMPDPSPWQPPIRHWLVTTDRVIGRLGDDRLYGWRWEDIIGCRIDLTARPEVVAVDVAGEPSLVWSGPGTAPLAVAAIFYLFGPTALLEHPGLAPIRFRDAEGSVSAIAGNR